MKVQITNISKTYHDFDEAKIKIVAKIDEDLIISGSTELIEMYEDAVSFAETYIQKDIAYTLKEYKFFGFCGDTVVLDEGNFIEISGITYTDNNNIECQISAKDVIFNGNKVTVTLTAAIGTEVLTVRFYTGYEQGKMHRNARRAIYVIVSDLYNTERSSYSIQQSQRNDIIERYLNPIRKDWHIDYNKI